MLTIKPEHTAGFAHAAAKAGAESAEEFAQARLDELGASYEDQRQRDERTEEIRVFELARKLPEEKRSTLKAQVFTWAVDHGLTPAE